MSASRRDRDIRKLRQIAKAKNALFTCPCSRKEAATVRLSVRFVALQAEFDALFLRYGNNPSIFKDSMRAGSKRNAAKKALHILKRNRKRSVKQKFRSKLGKTIHVKDTQVSDQAHSLEAAR